MNSTAVQDARDQPLPFVIDKVKAVLESLGVQYAVIGAMAMAARGYPRFTLDFDILTTEKTVLNPDVWREILTAP